MIGMAICDQIRATAREYVTFEQVQGYTKPYQGAWMEQRSSTAGNPHGHNLKATLDVYVRQRDRLQGRRQCENIIKWADQNQGYCEIKGADGLYDYFNVRVRPISTPGLVGIEPDGLATYQFSLEVTYDTQQ